MNIHINSGQLTAELEALAAFSDAPAPAVTRVVYSAVDLEGRAYVKTLFAEAGLEVREDYSGGRAIAKSDDPK